MDSTELVQRVKSRTSIRATPHRGYSGATARLSGYQYVAAREGANPIGIATVLIKRVLTRPRHGQVVTQRLLSLYLRPAQPALETLQHAHVRRPRISGGKVVVGIGDADKGPRVEAIVLVSLGFEDVLAPRQGMLGTVRHKELSELVGLEGGADDGCGSAERPRRWGPHMHFWRHVLTSTMGYLCTRYLGAEQLPSTI
jgi:hypothetical protein